MFILISNTDAQIFFYSYEKSADRKLHDDKRDILKGS